MPLILKILVPIALGAVIGYFTNDLAIRMLFRPRRPVFIGKWRLPFTPGIIPKNQSRIAKAVANAVSGRLFTSGDLIEQIKGSAAKEEIAGRLTDAVFGPDVTLRSLTAFAVPGVSAGSEPAVLPEAEEPPVSEPEPEDFSPFEETDGTGQETGDEPAKALPEGKTFTGAADKVGAYVADLAVKKLNAADLHIVIEDMVWEGIQEYRKNPLIALFLNEAAVDTICDKVEGALRSYMQDKGRDLLRDLVTQEARATADRPLCEIAEDVGLKRERVEKALNRTLDRFAEQFGASFSEKTDIAGIVQKKIEEMDAAQLEELVMSVMKKELQAVINLGALLGAVIGAINILF
jgi:uncharacterized membrane protein YheB (UPF0754 family)